MCGAHLTAIALLIIQEASEEYTKAGRQLWPRHIRCCYWAELMFCCWTVSCSCASVYSYFETRSVSDPSDPTKLRLQLSRQHPAPPPRNTDKKCAVSEVQDLIWRRICVGMCMTVCFGKCRNHMRSLCYGSMSREGCLSSRTLPRA